MEGDEEIGGTEDVEDVGAVFVVIVVAGGSGKKISSGPASAVINSLHLASYIASSSVISRRASFFCRSVRMGTEVRMMVWYVEAMVM